MHPLVFDGHNDTLQALYVPKKMGRDIVGGSPAGHLDLPRAARGGFGGGLFAIFAPSLQPGLELDPVYARKTTEQGMDALVELERQAKGKLRIVRDMAELRAVFGSEAIAAVMHVEGAEGIDPGLACLEDDHARGLRSIGIVWSRPNAFGTGVNFEAGASPDQGPGLTDAGKAFVKACNELGILIDLSHLNEKGFWDVARLSTAPLVATHSCVYRLSPSPRNLTDAQLDAVKASNGVVGINFATAFLRPDNATDPETPLSSLVHHISYVADRLGAEHVALGSDFDGCTISRELGDVTGLPRLMDKLKEAGFDQEVLELIAHKNWFRVLEATWKRPH